MEGLSYVARTPLVRPLVLSLALTGVGSGMIQTFWAYRMLTTLHGHGMVEFEETRQLWFIGVETFRIGSAFLHRHKLLEIGRAIERAIKADVKSWKQAPRSQRREIRLVDESDRVTVVRLIEHQ